jgi:hypothetical protein
MLLAAPVAHAAPFTPSLNYAYALALRHWGTTPPGCSSIEKRIVGDTELNGGEWIGEATIPAPGEVLSCHVYIVAELSTPNMFERACAAMRHEVGHLEGYGHSSDPHNIMYPAVTFIPSECDAAMLWTMNHPRLFRARYQ